MARPEKEALVSELVEAIQAADGLLLTDYRGLTVKQMAGLRRMLRAQGVSYRVIKNTLLRRALDACGKNELSPIAEGPTAIGFVRGEIPAVVKELVAFAKTTDKLPVLKGGLVEGKVLGAADVVALATLPSREQLLANLLGLLQAPLATLVATLQAAPARVVSLLQAVAEKKNDGAASESAPA